MAEWCQTSSEKTEDHVASITKDNTTNYYCTLPDAVGSASANDTIVMENNYSFPDNSKIVISKNLILDLNWYLIEKTYTDTQYLLDVNSNITLTIKDSGWDWKISRKNWMTAIRVLWTLIVKGWITESIDNPNYSITIKCDEDGVWKGWTVIIDDWTIVWWSWQAIQAWGDVTLNGWLIQWDVISRSHKWSSQWNPWNIIIKDWTIINWNVAAIQWLPTAEIAKVNIEWGEINGNVSAQYNKSGVPETNTLPTDEIPEGTPAPLFTVKWWTFSNTVPTEYLSNDATISVVDAEAKIWSIEYKTLSDAISAAQADDTVTLLDDVIITETVVIEKNLTIDLNGKDITAPNTRALWIKNGDVIITGEGEISANGDSDTSSVIRVGDKVANASVAKLTVDKDVTISSTNCYGITVFGYNDTDSNNETSDIEVVINGKVNVSGTAAGVSGNGTNALSATIITIGATAEIVADNTYAIYHPGKGTLTINGKLEGKWGIEAKAGKVIINDGAIVKATATAQEHNPYNNGPSTFGYAIAAISNKAYVGDPKVTINGGNIAGEIDTLLDDDGTNNAKIEVLWWIFTGDPTEYVISGNMVGQSETEYIVWTTADLKDIESDANYIASPTTKVAFWDSAFDDTTLSSWSVEIEVVENTGSAINNNDKPADWDMKVNEGNTATVEWQVDIAFSWHSNAKFDTPMLIRIPIISGKSKARFMVRHKWDSKFNYKGLTTNPNATCTATWDVAEVDKYNWEEVTVTGNYAVIGACSASTFVAYTETAKVTSSSSSSSGTKKSSSSSSSSTTTKKDDKKDDTQVIELKWEVTEESTTTWEVKEENTKSDVIISDAAKAAYNDEQLAAYQWAYDNGITTINDVDKARLSDPLTRAELAKMMSQYISSVLKKSPIKADKPEYKDVDESLGDLADFIVKAYQYQIMGINADGSALENFNPNGLVTRAEFATVFSRVLYWDKNNQAWDDYYSKHIAALKEAGILSNDDPTIQEVRGWVMLMMYRSANEKAPTQDEQKTEEWTGNNVWIANPASTYCVEQEWEIEIREDAEWAQYGVCKFKDGTEVEEWEYFRANHKDEASTGVVAESSTGAVAETTTWTVAENATGVVATTWAAENN